MLFRAKLLSFRVALPDCWLKQAPTSDILSQSMSQTIAPLNPLFVNFIASLPGGPLVSFSIVLSMLGTLVLDEHFFEWMKE